MKLRSITGKVSEIMYSIPGTSKRRRSGVIITAAGNGSRMGNVAKQLLEIAGHPVICYSLRAFEESPNVDRIVVVTREEDVEAIRNIVDKYGFKKVSDVTVGGNTRDESVKNGFEKLGNSVQYVAIHDAARPLITPQAIDSVFRDAFKYGAACAVAKVTDTVKMNDGKGFIKKTLPREELFCAQTPQIFACDIYRTALSLHLKEKKPVTDDCSIVENAGFKIKLTDINCPNMKLTFPYDFDIIEAILKKRGAN